MVRLFIYFFGHRLSVVSAVLVGPFSLFKKKSCVAPIPPPYLQDVRRSRLFARERLNVSLSSLREKKAKDTKDKVNETSVSVRLRPLVEAHG